MDFQIVDYEKELEPDLLKLFYSSVFDEREEFEYTRPLSWFERYKDYQKPIIKIAKRKDQIIGTLGILPTFANVNERIEEGGYFVDNCISPNFKKDFIEVMGKLFKTVSEEARDRKFKFIAGWDYLKNFKKNESFYTKLGFRCREGVNWFAGGLEYKKGSPSKWRKKNFYWGTAFLFLKLYNQYKSLSIPKNNKGFHIRMSQEKDLDSISEFINFNHPAHYFHCQYDAKLLREMWNLKGYRCLMAEKKEELISVLSFTVSTWTGMMYGRPLDDWEEFRTITLDEFVILEKFKNSKIPIAMIGSLLDFENRFGIKTNSNGFVTTVFDRSIEWKRASCKKAGFLEAKADYGVLLAKSLVDSPFNSNLIWSIPPRAIIAPFSNWI